MSGFGLERFGGENQNKPKSKATKENISAEEDGSSKKRRFAVVESKDLDSSTRTQNTSNKKRISLAEIPITRISFIHLVYMEIYKEKQDQKLVPIYKFICLK